LGAHRKDSFDERLKAAASARKAALERFHAQPGPDDPAVVERRAAQLALSVAREARIAERKTAREAEAKRQAAEQADRAAEQAARAAEEVARSADEATRRAALDAEKKARALALAAEQKAARDARYAARKARQRR
jgi:Family of unknown function (DUF6481)